MRHASLFTLSAAGSMVLSAAVAAAPVHESGRPFHIELTPGAERPGPGDPNTAASGTADLTINPGQERICYTITVSNLTGAATAAHIHIAPATTAGPVVIPLVPAVGSNCVDVDRSLAQAIIQNPQNYYVNVHTALRPGGAVRGQLSRTPR